MSKSAEDIEVNDSVLLPKAKAADASRYLLKNLDADRVVKLISNFQPGSALSGNVLASAFGPSADRFIKQARIKEKIFSTYLTKLGELWDSFCLKEINTHFEKLVQAEGIQIRDEILYYPLFARRRIAEIIRVKSPALFMQLICVRPYSFYSVSQLWDPNSEVSNAVRDYYSQIVKAYLNFNSTDISADSYFDFVNIIKSPYRELYEISDLFESDYTGGKFRAIYLKQLATARTGAALSLRKEQIEGMAHRSFYMPPPVTVEAISMLTLRWLSEQSLIFKNDLPAVLLEFVQEQDLGAYKKLLPDLGRKITTGILKGVEIGIEAEFPEFDQGNICFKEIVKKHGREVNYELFKSPIHCELLATAMIQKSQEYEDKQRDRKRVELGISYLRGRRLYRPWEIKTLNQEIRSLQREYYQLELELNSISQQRSLLKEISDKVFKLYPEEKPPLLFEIADRICEDYSLENLFKSEVMKDPLLLAEVFSFENKKSKIDLITKDLEELGYIEAKLKNSRDKELVDYLHIWREINAGVKLKSLKKEFTDFRVNRVLVEYEHRVNKKSYAEIISLEPKLNAIASLVRSREQLDQVLSDLAEKLIKISQQVAGSYFLSNNPKDELEEFQNYSESVGIIWDWLTLQDLNPYRAVTLKAQKFQPWFEKELCQVIREKDKKCYQALSYMRPASVLGVEPGADFNWKDVDVFQEHVAVLTECFLEFAELFPKQEVLTVFARFKGGIASPFEAFLNFKRYDLDCSTDKILLLDDTQKHLFTSRYRRDALDLWVKFHHEAFFGLHPLNGLFFELILKELKTKHKNWHLILCLQLLEIDRNQLNEKRQVAYDLYKDGDVSEDLLSLIQVSTEKIDFLEGLRRALSE